LSGTALAMNAITLLKNDHKTVEDLFKRFEKLGPRARKTKQDVVERIVRELYELERMSPTDERFDAKVTVLTENVRHHVEEEEKDLFPKVNKIFGRAL